MTADDVGTRVGLSRKGGSRLVDLASHSPYPSLLGRGQFVACEKILADA